MSSDLLWLIPGLPLAAAIFVALFGRVLRGASHWPVLLAAGGSCFLSLWALSTIYSSDQAVIGTQSVNWFSTDSVDIAARLVVDPISAIMLSAITFVGFWIAVFSVGYMHDDPGYPRFFAAVSLFIFSMTLLV